MNNKAIERISTRAGVILLGMLAIFGVLGCFEIVFGIDYFHSRAAADFWTVIPLITCVLIFCCFLVSTMLNIYRMAESMEDLANIGNKKVGKDVNNVDGQSNC